MLNETIIELPGKTFLFGEYLATQGGPSLIFTSTPLFKLQCIQSLSPSLPFHPESPAGKFHKTYEKKLQNYHFSFINPYGLGGLGASTAEFLSLYLFTKQLLTLPDLKNHELVTLYQSFNSSKGTLPSGADLIAQYHTGISYFNPAQKKQCSHLWPFETLSLLLFHTNQKLATHEHLKSLTLNDIIPELKTIAESTYKAFQKGEEKTFTEGIQHYGKALESSKLIAPHTQKILKKIQNDPNILASKGCGALGADVILIVCRPQHKEAITQQFKHNNLPFIADETSLYSPKVC